MSARLFLDAEDRRYRSGFGTSLVRLAAAKLPFEGIARVWRHTKFASRSWHPPIPAEATPAIGKEFVRGRASRAAPQPRLRFRATAIAGVFDESAPDLI
jgi:hypothetical protein